MWLTRLSIQRPVFVIVLMTFFIVLGWRSRGDMNVEMNPKVDIPWVTITTIYPGAGPEEIETLVSKPLEDAVSAVNGVKNVTSTSQYGVSYVSLEFAIGTPIDVAAADVRQKVDGARRNLPNDVEPPVIAKFDIGAMPVLYMGMSGGKSIRELRYLADTVVKYRLAKVPGVGSVGISGGQIREIRVAVHRDRLQSYGLSINDVVGALGRANLNLPSGRITEGQRDYDARVIGEFQSVDEIRNVRLPVRRSNGVLLNLRLADVADVADTIQDPSEYTRVYEREGKKMTGGDSVGVVITKLSEANTVEVIHGVKKELEGLKKELPQNIRFVTSQDQSTQIEAAMEDVNVSLFLGAGLAVLVIFLFLHNLRGTIICAIAIPTSLIATFIPMHFLGFTMNQMTMLGLSLVVGILVDDSIVVLENIYRHLDRGERPREAAFNGRAEIGLAAITITMVDVVVFVPIAFMGGIVGQFFRQFGLTVAFSTLFSLLVSFTVTPMLASRWYKVGEEMEGEKRGFFGLLERILHALDRVYRRLLSGSLRHRELVIVAGVVSLFLVMGVFGPRLGFQFFPVVDQGQLIATVELAPGTGIDRTDGVIRRVEEVVRQVPEVKSVFTNVGQISSGMRSSPEQGRQFAQLSISLIDKVGLMDAIGRVDRLGLIYALGLAHKGVPLRTRADHALCEEIRGKLDDIAGAQILVMPVRGFGGAEAAVQIELSGFDLVRMGSIAEQMRARIGALEGITDPDVSLRAGKPELQVRLDRVRAAAMGFDLSNVAMALRNSLEGNTDAKFRERGEEFNIRVQFADLDRNRIESVRQVVVGSVNPRDGLTEPVYLGDVATVTYGAGPTKIDRKNRLRKVVVTANLAPGRAMGNMIAPISAAIADIPLGDIRMEWAGEAQRMGEEGKYMGAALLLAIILVYLLMAALFDNLLHPFTIMLSLPMALVGAIAGLAIAGKTLSIISMIGIIMLVGLVTKNAILLVDYTNTLRARWSKGNETVAERRRIRTQAIEEAGPTRLRPILMTTVAMICGMMPIALGIGRASEQRSPLAVAVIGGLCVSALLTLVMIPVIYSYFDDIMAWFGSLLGNGRRKAQK